MWTHRAEVEAPVEENASLPFRGLLSLQFLNNKTETKQNLNAFVNGWCVNKEH